MHRSVKIILAITLGCATCNIWAADQAAKEETTPLPAAGALTVDQIPPITSLGKATVLQPAATPTTNNNIQPATPPTPTAGAVTP